MGKKKFISVLLILLLAAEIWQMPTLETLAAAGESGSGVSLAAGEPGSGVSLAAAGESDSGVSLAAAGESGSDVSLEMLDAAGVSAQAQADWADALAAKTGRAQLKCGDPVAVSEAGEASGAEDALDAVGGYSFTEYGEVAGWDDYASNYYYNRMSGWKKQAYAKMDEAANYYLNMPDTIQDSDGDCYMEVDLSDLHISLSRGDWSNYEALCDVFWLFYLSNPQYFFVMGACYVDYTVRMDSTGTTSEIRNFYIGAYDGLADGSSRRTAIREINGEVAEVLAAAEQESGQLAQEAAVHDWICQRVLYDYDFIWISQYASEEYAETYEQEHYTQSVYSVLCAEPLSDKEQWETVCAGYAQTFSLLCNALDIDAVTVTSSSHEWNRVRLDGNWYNVDCTWDDIDPVYEEEFSAVYGGWFYQYFNRNFDYFSDSDHEVEQMEEAYMPSSLCAKDKICETGDTNGVKRGTVAQADGICLTPSYSAYVLDNSSTVYVTLSSQNGEEVYYTSDGTTPTVNDAKSCLYTDTFTVDYGAVIQAVAYKSGYADSAVLTAGTSALEQRYTVNFKGNGGKVAQSSLVVTKNEKYGTLPNATRKGYAFLGWYTKKSGGTKITKSSIVKLTGETTLYAHWKKITAPARVGRVTLKSPKTKRLKVTITKLPSAKGYQIRCATNASFTKNKKKTTVAQSSSGRKVSKTLTGLKAKKKYYVQVRAYKVDSAGNRIYGNWSRKVSLKIK